MKKLALSIIGLIMGVTTVAPFTTPVFAQEAEPVRIHVFEREDCPHCIDEKAFLNGLLETRDDIQVIFHDVYDKEQKAVFIKFTEALELPKVTPLTVVGTQVFQGYSTDETTGQKILDLIESEMGSQQFTATELLENGAAEVIAEAGETCDLVGEEGECDVTPVDYSVDIPFFGTVDIGKYSITSISLILGFVDGFNPCAMWVLVMFLIILAEIGSKRRMFQVAGLFLLAEAIMYYLILNVWMFTWDFIGLDRIVTPIVGVVATTAGLYFLYLWYKADTTCKVGSVKQKQRVQSKMRSLAEVELTLATAAGILILAFSVNIIEFACSIGIPQTFTKLLDINFLSMLEKQWYNFLYIIMYMIDDLIVFGIAIYSFDKIGLTTAKYTRASHLIGGVIMLILGLIFLIDPAILVFG